MLTAILVGTVAMKSGFQLGTTAPLTPTYHLSALMDARGALAFTMG